MNGLVNKAIFFLLLGGIFALAAALAIALGPPIAIASTAPISGTFIERLRNFYSNFAHLRLAAVTAFTSLGVFIWFFATWLWRLRVFYPWLVTQRDFTGTWFMDSTPGSWERFRTLMHIKHDFFGIRVRLIRKPSLGRSLSANLQRSEAGDPRLYMVYESCIDAEAQEGRPVPHNVDHLGCLRLDLSNESNRAWWTLMWSPIPGAKLSGEYWTNKERAPEKRNEEGRVYKDKGTWGTVTATWQASRFLAETDCEVVKWLGNV